MLEGSTSVKYVPDIEIYKIFVETAERNIDRRLQANRYFFTVIAGVFAAYAFLAEARAKGLANQFEIINSLAFVILPTFLSIISLSWFLAIRAFRSLSTAKYAVIHRLEQELPQKPFIQESEAQRVTVLTGTRIEMIIPLIFLFLALTALLLPVYNQYGAPFLRHLGFAIH